MGRRDRLDRRPAPAGASAATSAAPGRSSSTRAPAGCWRRTRRAIVDDEEWDWIVEHAERRLRPPADRDHGPLPALARLPPPRGLERAALRRRLGRAGGARRARSCAAQSTSTTGPPSASSFAQLRDLLDEVGVGQARQGAGLDRRPLRRRPPRLPVRGRLPRPGRGDGAAPSTRRSARPTATRSTTKERRVVRAGFAPALQRPRRAACAARRRRPRPRHPLAHPRGPLLRQPGRDACASTAAAPRSGSTRPSPARRTRRRWKKRSSAG